MEAGHQDLNLRNAYQHLAAEPRADRKGKIYVFTSPKSGAGTSFVARNMALIAAERCKDNRQVLLLDMDLQKNSQSTFFASSDAASIYGSPAGPYDATFGAIPFWRVTPSAIDAQGKNITDNHFMSLHLFNNIGLSFSHFRWDNFRPGQQVHIQNARPYWQKLREHFHAIFIDTPSLDRSDILNKISPEADTSILVSRAENSKDLSLSYAMKQITAMGAHCSGVIINESAAPSDSNGVYYE